MKKKLIAVFAATAVAACTLFAGCSKDSDTEPAASETFEGVVSTQTYNSQQDAAKDFIEREISGEDYQVTYAGYAKEADLTAEEVTSLNIADSISGTIESVEKGKISFSEASGVSTFAAGQGSTLYVTVYIIKYTPEGSSVSTYKYMIPLPANNEVLTYSYYNSVMNPENFKNCTATVTTTSTSMGQSQSVSQTMQITESAIKMNLTVPVSATSSVDATAYFVDSTSGVKCAIEYMGECEVMSAASLGFPASSISELYATSLNEAQYSLFIKTDYGFKMREEALGGVIDAAFDAIFSQYEQSGIDLQWTKTKAECTYKVVDGKLYKTAADLGINMTVSYGGESATVSVSSKVECVYTNYGTTSVTISNAAKQALGIN